jgi:NitT/TauT family transport system ATP-binding protein
MAIEEPVILIEGLSKAYGEGASRRLILDSLNLAVPRGRFTSIVGPSGAGKTTMLRCIAGLLKPTGGRIVFEGTTVEKPPAKLAVVFQDYSRSLLPWLTVVKNVMLPLKDKGIAKSDQRLRATDALHAVGLGSAVDLYPWQLSGGMQQRVAIARALAYSPDALLMDEPFASVDAQTRNDLEDLLLRVHEEFGVTVLFVTHDIDEAVYLSDEVVVLAGSPARVVDRVVVPLGRDRDQFSTKALPEFSTLRNRILHLIREHRTIATTQET